jgi:hypothetical protein
MALVSMTMAAAEPSLVPAAPGTAPDYFCTWNVQGFACGYSGASNQADMMTEASLFGKGTNQNWTGFYPGCRADLIFLLDDACDFPLGGGHNCPARGSLELDTGRFPSYQGTPAERLAGLSRDVRARGWRGLGLWVCNSRPRAPGLEKLDSDTYWNMKPGLVGNGSSERPQRVAQFPAGAPLLPEAQSQTVLSPDSRIRLSIALADGRPQWQVALRGEPLTEAGALGLQLASNTFRAPFVVERAERSSGDTTWRPVWGNLSEVREHYNELTLTLREAREGGRRFQIAVRAYNEGVACRYHVPAQPGL